MIFTVAIDGPAAAGKGTIGRAVAQRFGFRHLDTGLLYRAVGALVLEGAEPIAAAQALKPEALEKPSLRTSAVGQAASEVAVIPEVRAALLEFQRAFARSEGGAVLDGRDIGTVICPEAEVKLFVTASAERRAERRHAELLGRGFESDPAEVLAEVRARDARDSARDVAPLVPAADGVTLDTSDIGAEEAVARAVALVEGKLGRG
ncbi:(d)CMP kinase [Pseudoroseicyclus aestuarii]|uniref:Cytidylate kinase n=1 Tax=Pseudoroseicyclus aestuarii TaxID=1795041 RepID=A0A318SR54_9RHOB|nr:d(CMP) kinase [Pseudoroseicyclus aestuarii]PYE84072.1 cytidylate kinase [Pseudoroseicyclus aestuarii]